MVRLYRFSFPGYKPLTTKPDSLWGLVDVFVDTNFPDIRNLTVVENNGRVCSSLPKISSIFFTMNGLQRAVIVPRENDMVRFTVHLTDSEVPKDPVTGRIDRSKVLVDKIIQVHLLEYLCPLC
jgi:phenol 2-monooxygenase